MPVIFVLWAEAEACAVLVLETEVPEDCHWPWNSREGIKEFSELEIKMRESSQTTSHASTPDMGCVFSYSKFTAVL